MNRKEKIYLYISSKEYIPLTFDELKLMLDVPPCDLDEFKEILNELVIEGKIFVSKKGRYASCASNQMATGILRCNARKKFGFVLQNDSNDIYISEHDLNTAIDGDKVLVKKINTKGNKPEGVVLQILERTNSTLSAVLEDDFTASADNIRIYKKIKLTDLQTAKCGDRVLVELTDYSKKNYLIGRVISVLGNSRELKTLTDAIIYEHKIPTDFSEDVIDYLNKIPKRILKKDTVGRADFTDKLIFTIDGDDARDFDDAVSLEILENGNYELGVHIADVSHYVKEGSPLDYSAYSRGTSVYLADRVIPMLPASLSNGICSLNPKVKRLTLSVIMEINQDGEVKSHKLVKSVIRSCHRMTYDNVAEILNGNTKLCEKYADIVPVLIQMHKLSKILEKRRIKRGSINFDFPETKPMLDKSGNPKAVVKIIRNEAHKLIEEFMLIANETIAEFAFWSDIPFVYRVHEEPDADKIDSFLKFIGNFGLYIKGNTLYPKDLQHILNSIKDTENENLIATYMLRSLMKAEYKTSCIGHFGLAAKYYCHFTSPIRRYPDLIIHRILKDFIDGNDVSHYNNYVSDAARHSSECEVEAEYCERDVDDLFKTAYISDFIGQEFTAQVSGVTSFGIFAELENGIEGLIRLETIDGDYYEYNEALRQVIGKRHKKTYSVGDSVEIVVVHTDITTRQIDFELKECNLKRKKTHKEQKRNKKWKNLK